MSDWISTFPGFKQVLVTGKTMLGRIILTGPVPQHVGIIMDGNRRYAKTHKIEIKEGHSLGFDTMASILELLYELGVKSATVYAFSIENFKRLQYEVKWLMDLAKSKFTQINEHGLLCKEYGVKIRILGNKRLLPKDVLEILEQTEEITKDNTRAVLNVCFPYTSRDEITHLIKSVVDDSTRGDLEITETTIDKHLYTSEVPPLDLLVRTSGTYRLSDFLLWQTVSPDCAIVFVDKLWPAFSPWDMLKILVNWGYNKYMYGNPNGYGISNKLTVNEQLNMELIGRSGARSTGFDRYLDDEEDDEEDDDDDDTEVSSNNLGTEDTVNTSEEEGDMTKKVDNRDF
ncbi:Dehydrodolichyl diphosphate synthase complex subunit RER2 [Candida viswanathii]|uniref:Alkyl transferase n=1 Tax=Candida viswanathii TaxID=5486 RepID=A0A367YKV1_9ASCO|nr:Dehydrodolichyl diphosphate synthase complex subunit RER2 [Candida viswanathii]